MKWFNLKQNKCPQCDKDFMIGLKTVTVLLSTGRTQLLIHGCSFKISEKRYAEIVNSQVTKDLESKWDEGLEGGELNGSR